SLILDSVKLRSILDQLLSNSLKFTSEGGIKIDIQYQESGDSCSLSMSFTDSGIGISEEDLKKIFEKFTQVDSSDCREFEGTGLGRARCSDLIELMDGTIEVQSKLGEGSTFVVNLPLKKTEGQDSENGKEATARILLIEDNITSQAVISSILEKMDHSVDVVSSGAAGLTILEENKYDLLLISCSLPGISAYETTRLLRQKEELKDLSVIALTAKALKQDKCFEAGMNDFIVKPVSAASLKQVIKNVLLIKTYL
ncbi:MAG: response regulator, partial [Lentisphaeraceae bacterium]|nr:response regulator [Lentisphaeraceae bacterium]